MREIAQSERRTRRLVEKLPQPLDLGPVLSVVDPTLFQPVLAQICEFVTSLAQPLVLGLELLNPATLAFSLPSRFLRDGKSGLPLTAKQPISTLLFQQQRLVG
jgi:hypothetical protein